MSKERIDGATLAVLNCYRNKYYAEGNNTEQGIVANAINDVLPILVDLKENSYRKQEWISVDERLPERLGYYLAYTTRGTIEIARFYPYYVNDKPQFDYWIAYWMPLPEPPKMKG